VVVPCYDSDHYFVLITKRNTSDATVYVMDSLGNHSKKICPSVSRLAKLLGQLHQINVKKVRLIVSEQTSGNCGPNSIANIQQFLLKCVDCNQNLEDIIFDYVDGFNERQNMQRIITEETRTYVVETKNKIEKESGYYTSAIDNTDCIITDSKIRKSSRSTKGQRPDVFTPPS